AVLHVQLRGAEGKDERDHRRAGAQR
ncbi:MAG: hypothetical protein QOD65_1126, partial [Gaiellales bacterium]|nr:hypothetical protein [Gaiellales bacterium]